MANDIGSPTKTARPPFAGVRRDVQLMEVLRRWGWLAALLIVLSLVVGGSVQHAIDQRSAA